jgi:hypothetical protein
MVYRHLSKISPEAVAEAQGGADEIRAGIEDL